MAEDTQAGAAEDVKDVEHVLEASEGAEGTSTHRASASPPELSPPQDARDDLKPIAHATAAIGKRAVDEDSDASGKDESGEDLPPRKKARKDSAATSSSVKDSPSPPYIPSHPAAPGIAISGLRTSFAKPAAPGPAGTRVTRGNIDFVMHTPLTTDERNQFIAALRDYEAMDVECLTKRKLDWTVGPIRTEWLIGNTWLEIWESIIDKWCQAFLVNNQANIAEVGLAPHLLKIAFQRRLHVEAGPDIPPTFKHINRILLKNPDTSRLRNFAGGFKPDQDKKARRQARTAAQAVSAGGDAVEPSTEAEGTNAQPDHDQVVHNDVEVEDGEITSGDASGIEGAIIEDYPPPSQAELDQRHRYFPNIPDDAIFCLICAQAGHATASCPDLTCKFCQGAHFKYECPTRQRCSKCKQLGHANSSCPEKLAGAPGEIAIECAICESHDHTEINCIQLFQIYRPQPGKVQKVKSLPIFCYACGTEGHYGGDCSLADPSVPPTKVWTISTASLYIDPSNDNVALSYKNGLPPPVEVSRPNIPGRSIKPQTHVIFEESDGEGDGDFIALDNSGSSHRNKRAKRPNNTPAIQIASNISFGGNPGAGPSNQRQQQQQPQSKKKQDPVQPPNKSKKSGNDGGRRNRNKGPHPQITQPVNNMPARTLQPPTRGSGGRGGGNAGRGGGGFSQLNTKPVNNMPPRTSQPPTRGSGGRGGGNAGRGGSGSTQTNNKRPRRAPRGRGG